MISKDKFDSLLKNKEYQELAPFKVDNAVILAAGLSKRFKPISNYYPKGLSIVKGEVLIERQIHQLQAAGIDTIYVVVGYKKELFYYLEDKFNVIIVNNDEYDNKDNIESLNLVKDYLRNTYICSVDNYYLSNPFSLYEYSGYYSSVYIEGITNEWCVETDNNGLINSVTIGGHDADIMMGYVYFDQRFSNVFRKLLMELPLCADYWNHVWEYLYIHNLHRLALGIKRYQVGEILEFDSVEDVLNFDKHFWEYNGEKHFSLRIDD